MHLRGKSMLLEAILPDGTKRTLSYVDHFNFNWMINYIYADDDAPVLPKGTVIHVVAEHDNTANNKNNPDPNQWVGWGDRTVDEMAHAWVNVTYISEEDYQAYVAKHRPAPRGCAKMNVPTRIGCPRARRGASYAPSSRSISSRRTTPGKASRPPSKDGSPIPMAASASCSGTSTGIKNRSWIFPSAPTITSIRAVPDQGQPTHFLTRRRWGMFTITVPKNFAGKLTWTLVANGKTAQVPAGLDPLWELNPFKDATGNTPPFIGFAQAGPFVNGPRGQTQALSGTMANPVPLTVWVADDASVIPGATRPRTPAVTLTWSKFRGPGDVTFAQRSPGDRERPSARSGESRVQRQSVHHGHVQRTGRVRVERASPTIGPATAAAAFSAAGRTRR